MFLPLALREHLRAVRVRDSTGADHPLVRSERTLYRSSDPSPPASPPNWTVGYLAIGLVLGAAMVLLAGRASRRAGLGFLILGLGWVLLSGVGGLVLAGLWGLTDHVAAYYNENLLQLNPLILPLLWLLPVSSRKGPAEVRPAALLAFAIAALSLLGLLLKLLPAFYQVNGSVIALALPAHTGLAAALARRARGSRAPNPS